ncbi:glycosyltransferase [Geomonas nitrogeniifigens]|uniref:Glycosyltransferase n=1 Tax=Geomonas diazotrophica TaxID=2843197 RepID=A0ABX8JC98_9BACT|nr:glycosyltransferase family 4 protein [Geomonas nitrogeniifigens]QWV95943.1 glycosyltransferase [Geomonas nitrogeniifigens]
MRILEIITVPFFTPRGTAFSSLERTKALSRMGHCVDVLTYPLGDPVDLPNVSLHRAAKLPFINSLRMGPSFQKLVLDIFLAAKTARWLLAHGPYDLIIAHEESAFWVAFLRHCSRARFIYDMHSSLVEQLTNFKYSESGVVKKVFSTLENFALRSADGIIVICPELETLVRRTVPGCPVRLIENLPVSWDAEPSSSQEIQRLKAELGLDGCKVAMYTGSFGWNQGVELALDAVASLRNDFPELRLVLIGGTGADLCRVRAYAAQRDMESFSLVLEPQPHTAMPAYMEIADVLLSPRCEGTNTPLKIYSYLQSGKPIVATDLLTHTQVLSAEVAELVAPDAVSLAAGIRRILTDAEYARELGLRGARLAREVYGIERYLEQVQEILEQATAPDREREARQPAADRLP